MFHYTKSVRPPPAAQSQSYLRFISDIHRTFPGSEKLAHLRGNYTQWFVVLIDLEAQFLGVQTVWSVISALL